MNNAPIPSPLPPPIGLPTTPPWQRLTPTYRPGERPTITLTRKNPNIHRYIDADEIAGRLGVSRRRARELGRTHAGQPIYMGGGRQSRAAYYDRRKMEAYITAHNTSGLKPPPGYTGWSTATTRLHIGTPRLRDLIHQGKIRTAPGISVQGWPRTYVCITDLCNHFHVHASLFHTNKTTT